MLEAEESVDLERDVKIELNMWTAWLESDGCPYADAFKRYAADQQGAEMRRSVKADTACELYCRILLRRLVPPTWALEISRSFLSVV